MSRRPSRVRVSCLLVLVSLMSPGCGRDVKLPTVAPPPASHFRVASPHDAVRSVRGAGAQVGFYPLRVGNRWRYRGSISKTYVYGGSETVSKRGAWIREATILGAEMVDGQLRFREDIAFRDTTHGAPVIRMVRWLRQERTGLYETGGPGPLQLNPGALPVDASSAATLLTYPLHVGASWVCSVVPYVTAEVERMEILDTPVGRLSAWRIRLRDHGHLPSEEAFVWYGRAGYLGMKVHTVSRSSASEIVITVDQSEFLDAIDLMPRGLDGALVVTAKEALGALVTGEQVYYQRWGRFTDLADTDDVGTVLGVEMGELALQWSFSVSRASVTGFVARAEGRNDTDAEGIAVTLEYQIGQPIVWAVKNTRRGQS